MIYLACIAFGMALGVLLAVTGWALYECRNAKPITYLPRQPIAQPRDASGRFVSRSEALHAQLRREVGVKTNG
jgi:hypothetical protein